MNNIRKITIELLGKLKSKSLPIDIKKIAKNLGLKVIEKEMDDDISGFLYTKGSIPTIVYNKNHFPNTNRQRFTIAHELGHYCLKHYGELFLDRDYILFRDEHSKDGSRKWEREANKFAAEILMPEEMLLNKIVNQDINFDDDDDIYNLAKDFGVSTQALLIRLSNLGLNFM